MNLRERILCGWLDSHVGHPECVGGWMFFKCTRCGRLTHPIRPEKVAQAREEWTDDDGRVEL